MYFLLGISLALAGLFVLNVLFSALTTIFWRVVSPLVKSLSAKNQVRIVFALRFFPSAAALIFAVAFLIPAYLLFESRRADEVVTVKLALPAFVSLSGIVVAAFNVFRGYRRTKRLTAEWLVNAEPIRVTGVEIPVYQIRHPFPVIAVVGAFRPRMFVARQIFDSLDAEEFQAAVRHEYGHIAARDNLKRVLLGIARDSLIFPFGHSLDRHWTENVEAAADEYAARIGGKSAALNLASALVKIARIVPPNTKPAMPGGAFLIETRTADVTWRVCYLLRLAENKTVSVNHHGFKLKNIVWLYAVGIFALMSMLSINYGILQRLHIISESVVRFLQ